MRSYAGHSVMVQASLAERGNRMLSVFRVLQRERAGRCPGVRQTLNLFIIIMAID